MRVRFTHVRIAAPGTHHSHITNLKAIGDDGKPYDSTREKWVKFIEDGGTGYVHDRFGNEVGVYVNHNSTTKWVQTIADGKWTDNLLALPRY